MGWPLFGGQDRVTLGMHLSVASVGLMIQWGWPQTELHDSIAVVNQQQRMKAFEHDNTDDFPAPGLDSGNAT